MLNRCMLITFKLKIDLRVDYIIIIKKSIFISYLSKLMYSHRLLMGPKSLDSSRLEVTEMNLTEGFSNGFVEVSGVSCCSYVL